MSCSVKGTPESLARRARVCLDGPVSSVPIVIGHRGACGYVPEHTLASYFLAIQYGADFVEPDLVMTRDAVLVARHENEIGGTTDVAEHPEFASRRTQRSVDGEDVEGWFTEDFSLAELKTLRARERIPWIRPGNQRFDRLLEIPTFEEILALVRAADEMRAARARQLGLPRPPRIGIYPETKHPSHFAGRGLPLEGALVQVLDRHGLRGRDAPVWLQSFEPGSLIALGRLTQLPRVQLLEDEGAPFDFTAQKVPRTFADMRTGAGLAEIARYAQAIGPSKAQIIPRQADGSLGMPTQLVAEAHAHGLAVHPWTFRAENEFLPAEFRTGSAPADRGDLVGEIVTFLRCGIDGFFTDQADLGVAARAAFMQELRG
ncbi:MAG: glycerophosphodiester phosphodiesterase [Proteobacteria bacterium]|nr:glycerophosphodiester phosphodiesterase [Pseudomonadota bacterium]